MLHSLLSCCFFVVDRPLLFDLPLVFDRPLVSDIPLVFDRPVVFHRRQRGGKAAAGDASPRDLRVDRAILRNPGGKHRGNVPSVACAGADALASRH